MPEDCVAAYQEAIRSLQRATVRIRQFRQVLVEFAKILEDDGWMRNKRGPGFHQLPEGKEVGDWYDKWLKASKDAGETYGRIPDDKRLGLRPAEEVISLEAKRYLGQAT